MLVSPRDAARQIHASLKGHDLASLAPAAAPESDYPHLRLASYSSCRRWFGLRGFKPLGSLALPVLSEAPAAVLAPTVWQAHVSPDGLIVGGYCQLRPRVARVLRQWLMGLLRLRWVPATRVAWEAMQARDCLSFETEFSDGSFVITRHARSAEADSAPPSLDTLVMRHKTRPGVLFNLHRQRVVGRVEDRPDAQPVAVHDLAALLAQQRRQSVLRNAFRHALAWLSRAEGTTNSVGANAHINEVWMELRVLLRQKAP